ncbi:unnamed protein product [Phytophthora lilii]|uniref:Unnamed protein product n=1 Tax=Phytophthora lilii TaxID=2077276 RepID=A0A9W6UA45_9STRA|nr:unnamed protein product [Phytophthora lilii]
MARVATSDATASEYVYVFRPAKPLPVIELSKSLRGELFPAKAHARIHQLLTKYHQPLLMANIVAFCLISMVAVVSARAGQFISSADTRSID